MILGTTFYSELFDMGAAKALLVEARLLDQPLHPPAHATLRVQGTKDELTAERKCWADEGTSLGLAPGTEYRAIFTDMHGVVRVAIDPFAPGGRGRVEIHLTRLP